VGLISLLAVQADNFLAHENRSAISYNKCKFRVQQGLVFTQKLEVFSLPL
jgi:hypothetical protein